MVVVAQNGTEYTRSLLRVVSLIVLFRCLAYPGATFQTLNEIYAVNDFPLTLITSKNIASRQRSIYTPLHRLGVLLDELICSSFLPDCRHSGVDLVQSNPLRSPLHSL